MSNIGTNLGNAVRDIISWLTVAIKHVGFLLKAGNPVGAMLLLLDIQEVVTLYLEVISSLTPSQTVEPIPGNLFKKMAWFFNNMTWIQALIALLTGINPFEAAKARAREVAEKWDFADEVY